MEIRLSDPPRGTVTVTVDNVAGLGLFGFDKCMFTFTSANWYVLSFLNSCYTQMNQHIIYHRL